MAQNDYYAAGEIRPGQWIGAGAEWLRLAQAVTRDQFHAVCENQNPHDGQRLTQRHLKQNQRRVFYDFTCSPPNPYRSRRSRWTMGGWRRLPEVTVTRAGVSLRMFNSSFMLTSMAGEVGQRLSKVKK
jgi:hypothetical protein